MKKIITHAVKFILEIQRQVNIIKMINVLYYINRLEKANHLVISIDIQKAFEKSKLICDRNSKNKITSLKE